MSEKVLVEAYSGPVRVDRDAGVIRDCLLLGPVSRNGVTYPDATREAAVALFEGARACLSHPGERTKAALARPRRWEEQVGRYGNVRNGPDGLRGDLKVRKSHPYGPALLEAAEDEPESFGLSPAMLGLTTGRPGAEVCTSISTVRSVDVVLDPASTRGLFEQEDAPEDGPTAEQAYEQACNQAVTEVVAKALKGEITPEDAGKQVKELLKNHLKAFKKDTGGGEEAPEPSAEQQKMEEELRVLRTEKEARVLCEQNQVEPDPELIALLCDLPSRERRVDHLNYLRRGALVRKVKSGYNPGPAVKPDPDLVTTLRS